MTESQLSTCPRCGHRNVAAATRCQNCKEPLWRQASGGSKRTFSARKALAIAGVAALLGYCGKAQLDEQDARLDAERVAAAAQRYRELQGRYPATLSEIGFDGTALRKWHLSYQIDPDGKPRLFYSAQNNWLVAWHYDFATKMWYHVD